jgi:hypothetical protein
MDNLWKQKFNRDGETEQVVIEAKLWTYIQEVLGSNPRRDTGYPD